MTDVESVMFDGLVWAFLCGVDEYMAGVLATNPDGIPATPGVLVVKLAPSELFG